MSQTEAQFRAYSCSTGAAAIGLLLPSMRGHPRKDTVLCADLTGLSSTGPEMLRVEFRCSRGGRSYSAPAVERPVAKPWRKKSAWPYVAKSGRRSYSVGFYDHDKVERTRAFPVGAARPRLDG